MAVFKKRFRASLRLALAMLLCTASGFAGTTGKISGTITDAQTKEALAGVNVLVVGTALGAATDVQGTYFIINIPPGTYQLKVSAVGYSPVILTDLKVSADQTTRADITLQQQAIELQGVEVTATRPIVQRDLTSTSATVTTDQISKLPLEDVQAAVNLQAGVVEGHFRGGRSNEVKYLVDGVAVNDVFSGNSSLEAEVSSVQEIQVLSGTFNAEYGEALSGVVNQVTKTGGDKYSGGVSTYVGDYVSTHSDIFQRINYLSPTGRGQQHQKAFGVYNVDANLSGPLIQGSSLLRFFVSGKYLYDDGYIYGRRVFNPRDSSYTVGSNPQTWVVVGTGDGRYVPMNNNERASLQGKLSINLGNARALSLQGLYQGQNYRVYNHAFQLNPDGDYHYYQKSFLGSASYNHVFSDAAFLDANASLFETDYKQYVYEDPFDPRYANPEVMRALGPNTFLTGGTQNWHFLHHTNTYTAKIDITDQATRIHQLKWGIEGKYHTLRYQDFQIHAGAESGYRPAISPPGSFDNNTYQNHPKQLAAYVQDKIELDYLVVNMGLRFDYFQPDGKALSNPDNVAALDTLSPPYPSALLRDASAKSQFSPRVGLSYPISDKGAVHISYGHFFQIPAFEFLYKNPNFRITDQGTFPEFVGNTLGNPDLQPQRTTIYEIGLQQELADDLGIAVTGYYKDIRNLLGIQLHQKLGVTTFGEYVNRDYGAVKGITISFEKRISSNFGGNVDYTYQVAQGDASDPNADFIRAQAVPPIPSNKELVPLDWDRRHSLNVTLTLAGADNYSAGLITRLGSGLPYTPALENSRTGLENSDNRPPFFDTDIYLTKYLKFLDRIFSVFVKIYNVFDTENEVNVFTDTGRAGYTLELTRPQEAPRGVNTLQEYFTRPDFYSAPRQVIVGASVNF
jgi:outer membrane receptor protein involved in Fe transport